MKKQLLLLTLAALTLSGCGEKHDDLTKITIYAGGSGEYMWKKGSVEQEVYDAIQQEYEKQTGHKIKFNVEFLGKNMKDSITTGITDGDIDVVISHLGGGDGLDDWMLYQPTTLYRNLALDIEDYENIGKNMTWTNGSDLTLNALDRVTDSSKKVIALPSVVNPYKFGILVRKDWMEACGYSDEVKEGYQLVDNYETFEEMAKAMQVKFNLEYAVAGAVYEVEKSGLLGAYDVPAGYYTKSASTYNGKDIMDNGGLINSKYAEVLNVESRWIQNKVLSAKPDEKSVVDYESDFISGKAGIMVENPTVTHLIEVARNTKEVDPNASFTVLPALKKDKTSSSKGFMRNSVATFGAAITKNSKNADAVLEFINWCYASKENYELCRYGVEGKHWIKNGDGTYSYPAGYSYQHKPYSGICTLVENQIISDLTYKDFSSDEQKWFNISKQKENYLVNDSVDYLLFLNNKELLNLHFENRKEMYNFTQRIWSRSTGITFDLNHDHGTDADKTACKIKNLSDWQAVSDKYLSTTSSYSIECYNLYLKLKSMSRVK